MKSKPRSSPLWKYVIAFVLIGTAGAVVVTGLLGRRSLAAELRENAASREVRPVAVVSPMPVTVAAIELPGRIEAWARAPIYARVSGYLKSWSADIGSPVKAGQVLGEIEAPDQDQQLNQAEAELVTARNEEALAKSTAERWQSMTGNAVSRQEVDERVADLEVRKSRANALQANVDRMRTLQDYKRLSAPFDGVVTSRNTDVGSLINVGMSPGSELFVVSDMRRLRVYVSVPQRQVASIRQGGAARLTVPERPGRIFAAAVGSLSQAIDAGSGTMLVQLEVDNASGELLPGSYATVQFESPSAGAATGVPPSALLIGKDGVKIATVDGGNRARLRDVTIARDHGNIIELSTGLQPGEQVIANPPDGLADGDQVRVVSR